jgi:hypothetical protein
VYRPFAIFASSDPTHPFSYHRPSRKIDRAIVNRDPAKPLVLFEPFDFVMKLPGALVKSTPQLAPQLQEIKQEARHFGKRAWMNWITE